VLHAASSSRSQLAAWPTQLFELLAAPGRPAQLEFDHPAGGDQPSHDHRSQAVAIALVPFLTRPFATAGITYALLVGWSRVYPVVHFPLEF